MKFATIFSLIVSIILTGYFLFSMEEKSWESRAIRAGVGFYDETRNFQFKKIHDIFVQELKKEIENGNIQFEPRESPEKPGKLGGSNAAKIGGQSKL